MQTGLERVVPSITMQAQGSSPKPPQRQLANFSNLRRAYLRGPSHHEGSEAQ